MARGLERLINEYGNPPLSEAIYWGDNLEVLKRFPKESIDLIYLDPPFSSDKKYWAIWGKNDEAVLEAYEKACKGGINAYVDWMHQRVELMHKVLKETGSFYFHCDPQMSHYFKVMLDSVFDYKNFQNEIVWCYRGGGVPKNAFARKHDTIFFYSKSASENRTFNPQYTPYSNASQELVKSRGGVSIDGKTRDLERGAHMTDWWVDINALQTWSPGRTGYATQKPDDLLERIIRASSNEGDIVLDPFCGCGTAPIEAYRLKRKWVGIDITKKGCEETKERLEELGAYPQIIPWDLREEQLEEIKKMSGLGFQNWVLIRIGGIKRTGRDIGIDLYTSQLDPVQVKKPTVGPAVLRDFRTALQQEKKQRGYIIGLSGFSKRAIETTAKYKAEEDLEIELVNARELDNFF
ncbi:MAG: restriction endonuclease [Nanoarchaeota archaeon]|nr:restriction endonuclease [Nanoarchaeota archaeon]